MHRNLRFYLRPVLVTGSLLLVVALSCLVWEWQVRRQYALNRALIAALQNSDTARALHLVQEGADPNASYLPPPRPSVQDLWNQWLHPVPRSAEIKNPTAIQMACGLVWFVFKGQQFTGMGQCRPDAPALVEAMLRHGADAEVRDKDFNRTLLIWAAMEQRPATVEILLKHGADSGVKDLLGQTALMYSYSSAATRQLLLQQEARRKGTKR